MKYLLPFVRRVSLGDRISRKLIIRHGCLDWILCDDEVKSMVDSPEKLRQLKIRLSSIAAEYQRSYGETIQLEEIRNMLLFLEKSEKALRTYRHMLN